MAKKTKDTDFIKKIDEMGLFTKKETYINVGKPIIDSFTGGYTRVVKDKPTGFCRGKIYSYAGDSGIGKSTIIMTFVSYLVKQGYRIIYQDIEGGVNDVWIKNYELEEFIAKDLTEFMNDKNKKIFVYNPFTYDEAMTTIYDILNSTDVDCVVVDSFKQLAVDDIEEYITDIKDGSKGALMTASKKDGVYFPFMRSLAKKFNIVVLGIQQVRVQNVGTSFAPNFKVKAAGGNTYKHNTDTRYEIKLVERIKGKVRDNKGDIIEKPIGSEVRIESEKNRFGMLGLNLKLYFGKGISFAWLYIDTLIASGHIVQGGNTYTVNIPELFAENEKFTGKTALYNAIREKFADIEKFCYDNDLLYIEKEIGE